MHAKHSRPQLPWIAVALIAATTITSGGCAKLYHMLHYNMLSRAAGEHHRSFYHSPKTGRIIPHEHHANCAIEPPCFGYEATCWHQWPEECGRCPQEEVILDVPYSEEATIIDESHSVEGEIVPSEPLEETQSTETTPEEVAPLEATDGSSEPAVEAPQASPQPSPSDRTSRQPNDRRDGDNFDKAVSHSQSVRPRLSSGSTSRRPAARRQDDDSDSVAVSERSNDLQRPLSTDVKPRRSQGRSKLLARTTDTLGLSAGEPLTISPPDSELATEVSARRSPLDREAGRRTHAEQTTPELISMPPQEDVFSRRAIFAVEQADLDLLAMLDVTSAAALKVQPSTTPDHSENAEPASESTRQRSADDLPKAAPNNELAAQVTPAMVSASDPVPTFKITPVLPPESLAQQADVVPLRITKDPQAKSVVRFVSDQPVKSQRAEVAERDRAASLRFR